MRNSLKLKNKYLFVFCLVFFVFCGNANASKVLVDEGHGQAFLIEKNGPLDLSILGTVFKDQGIEVQVNHQKIQDHSFDGIGALVISGPFMPIKSDEINSIINFVEEGGRLCLMLHIPSPAASLLRKLGVVVSFTPINERENIIGENPKDFSIVSLAPHPITEGLDTFKVYGIWGVMNDKGNSKVIASASPNSWVDMNKNKKLDDGDGVYPYGVVAAGNIGKGSFVVFGDDAIFQNQFLKNENVRLAQNLAKWLQSK